MEEPIDQLAFLHVMAHHSNKLKRIIYKNNIQCSNKELCIIVPSITKQYQMIAEITN
uniref:Uncharacterized protein n=1 Tax=Arundo donax TaxID=35708 RepID=A0A0A9DMI7_ARUDO